MIANAAQNAMRPLTCRPRPVRPYQTGTSHLSVTDRMLFEGRTAESEKVRPVANGMA